MPAVPWSTWRSSAAAGTTSPSWSRASRSAPTRRWSSGSERRVRDAGRSCGPCPKEQCFPATRLSRGPLFPHRPPDCPGDAQKGEPPRHAVDQVLVILEANHQEGCQGHLDGRDEEPRTEEDRKSTRLNSSHPSISYAVFCLKKKTNAHEWRPHHTDSHH